MSEALGSRPVSPRGKTRSSLLPAEPLTERDQNASLCFLVAWSAMETISGTGNSLQALKNADEHRRIKLLSFLTMRIDPAMVRPPAQPSEILSINTQFSCGPARNVMRPFCGWTFTTNTVWPDKFTTFVTTLIPLPNVAFILDIFLSSFRTYRSQLGRSGSVRMTGMFGTPGLGSGALSIALASR